MNAKQILTAASSVRGAKGAGVETQALQDAPALLATANKWLSKTVPALTGWDNPAKLRKADAIEAAARELAEALELPAFQSLGDEVITSGYTGEQQ